MVPLPSITIDNSSSTIPFFDYRNPLLHSSSLVSLLVSYPSQLSLIAASTFVYLLVDDAFLPVNQSIIIPYSSTVISDIPHYRITQFLSSFLLRLWHALPIPSTSFIHPLSSPLLPPPSLILSVRISSQYIGYNWLQKSANGRGRERREGGDCDTKGAEISNERWDVLYSHECTSYQWHSFSSDRPHISCIYYSTTSCKLFQGEAATPFVYVEMMQCQWCHTKLPLLHDTHSIDPYRTLHPSLSLSPPC